MVQESIENIALFMEAILREADGVCNLGARLKPAPQAPKTETVLLEMCRSYVS